MSETSRCACAASSPVELAMGQSKDTKKPGAKVVVEEVNFLPREAGQTTEAAFQQSMAASPNFKLEHKPEKKKFRSVPLRPKKGGKNAKKKR